LLLPRLGGGRYSGRQGSEGCEEHAEVWGREAEQVGKGVPSGNEQETGDVQSCTIQNSTAVHFTVHRPLFSA